MRTRDATWQALALRGDFDVETKAIINNVEYTTISAPTLSGGTLSGSSISVGNCISTTLSFMVMTSNEIPRAAQVEIKCRLSDGVENGQRSQWMTMGKFWVNKRTVNDDWVTLECYDAMMAGNQPYSDDSPSINWPKAMSTVVARICVQMGVTLDARTTIKTGTDYKCTKPNDDDTLLDILQWIAEVHGGNWVITPENKLRLIPLVPPPPETYYIIDYSYNRIQTDDGYNLVWQHNQSQEVITNPAGGELINVPVAIEAITTATRYAISKITMTVEETAQGVTAYVAGNDTGYNLIIEQNPYATQGICNGLLTQLNGLAYAPYNVRGACFDPCAEYGDWVIVGDKVSSVLYNMSQTYGQSYRADISAPGEDEIEAEYPYQTPTQKMRKEISALNADGVVIKSEINQMQDSITLTVAALGGKADKSQIRSQFAMDSSSVTIDSGLIAFSGNTLTMSSTNFSVDSSGYLTCNGADISGELHTKNSGGTYYIDIQGGELHAGKIENNTKTETGNLKFANVTYEIYGTTLTRPGVQLHSQKMICLDSQDDLLLLSNNESIEIKGDNGVRVYTGGNSRGRGLQFFSGNASIYMDVANDNNIDLIGESINIGTHSTQTVCIGNSSGECEIYLQGPIHVDYTGSGYEGKTGYAYCGNITMNFRRGILVSASGSDWYPYNP